MVLCQSTEMSFFVITVLSHSPFLPFRLHSFLSSLPPSFLFLPSVLLSILSHPTFFLIHYIGLVWSLLIFVKMAPLCLLNFSYKKNFLPQVTTLKPTNAQKSARAKRGQAILQKADFSIMLFRDLFLVHVNSSTRSEIYDRKSLLIFL